MQFVYTGGAYREFRGYVFANGNPVTITDRHTEELLLKDHEFKKVENPMFVGDKINYDGKFIRKVEDEKEIEIPQKAVLKNKGGRPRKIRI